MILPKKCTFRKYYLRYLDDALIIFDDSKLPIETIGNLLNDMNTEFNFILETNGNEVNFLDLTIYKRDQTLRQIFFHKPTDSKQHLNFYSHHLHHTKVAIPYNLSVAYVLLCLKLIPEYLGRAHTKRYIARC